MVKRMISFLTVAALMLGIGAAAAVEQEDCIYYEDFENFSQASLSSGTQSIYQIEQDTSSYLSVSTPSQPEQWPTVTLDATGNLVLEFDVKGNGAGPKLYASFDGGTYRELFGMLADGRGPLLREPDNSPGFFYNQADVKPDYTQWNNIQLYFDFSKNKVTASCNGMPVMLYDREYQVKDGVSFSGTKLTGIKFGVDPTVTSGKAGYDNVMLYDSSAANITVVEDGPVDSDYLVNKEKLSFLSILTGEVKGLKMRDTLTRGQFLSLAMRAVGIEDSYMQEVLFDDVPTQSPYCAYVGVAAKMGVISTQEREFHPDDMITLNEAVKILVELLELSPFAQARGGYPTGYLILAQERDMLKDVSVVSGGQLMNMKDTAALLVNFLTVPMADILSYGEDIEYGKGDDTKTVLYQYHGLTELRAQIVEASAKKNQLQCIVNGSAMTYEAGEKISLIGLEGTVQVLWVDREQVVQYLTPYRDYHVVYAYVREYNNGQTAGEVIPSRITSLSFAGYEGKIGKSSDFEITVNGSAATEPMELVGAFGRAVICNGEMTRFDIYTAPSSSRPAEGGIVSGIQTDRILYTAGENMGGALETAVFDEILTVVDGVESEFSALKNGMVFDYCAIGQEKLVLAASSKTMEGSLDSCGVDELYISGTAVPVSSYPLYISADGGASYEGDLDPSALLGNSVTVRLDMEGTARYVASAEVNDFYGVVMACEKPSGLGDMAQIKIGKVTSGNLVEQIYDIEKEKETVYGFGLSFDVLAQNAEKLDGSGVYRFKASNEEILYVEPVQWLEDREVTITENFDYRAPRVKVSGKWYSVQSDHVLVLANANGDFEPRMVKWDELNNRLVSGVKARLEATMPISELLVITENPQNIYLEALSYGFITQKLPVSKDSELYYTYTIMKENTPTTITVRQDEDLTINGQPLNQYDYILYNTGGIFSEIGNIRLKGKVSLAAPQVPDTTSAELVYKNAGTYVGQKSGYLKTQLDGEEQWNMLNPSGYAVYSVNEQGTKFTTATLSDAVGKKIGIVSVGDLVRMIVFTK